MKTIKKLLFILLITFTSCMTAAPDYVCPTYRYNVSTKQGMKAQTKYVRKNR